MSLAECLAQEIVSTAYLFENILILIIIAYENCGGSRAISLIALDGIAIHTTGESRAYPLHEITFTAILTTSLTLAYLIS